MSKEDYSKLFQFVIQTSKTRNNNEKADTSGDSNGNAKKVNDEDGCNQRRSEESDKAKRPMTWSEASQVPGPSG